MKKVNDYWVDENNNSWYTHKYTEEQARELSETLKYCFYCIDSQDCQNCFMCTSCINCTNCFTCSCCNNCINCTNCTCCDNCINCRCCRNCQNCHVCMECYDCIDYAENPMRYVTPKIGSRNDQTSVYWTNKDDVQIVCGCFRGDLEFFTKRVRETYPDPENLYRIQYEKQIKIIKMNIDG